MTTFKMGDRVRCTLGESVLVGEIGSIGRADVYVHPDSADRGVYLASDVWFIEIIPPPAPPLPEVKGTVVLDKIGRAWQRFGGNWIGNSGATRETTNLIEWHGPLTVIYVPEVTS